MVKSASGQLHTHLYAGTEALDEYLERVAGDLILGTYLEIISPYFDYAMECRPLQQLINRFQPKAVRVYLPRSSAGEALCRPELYEAVRAMPRVEWGCLPNEILRLGQSKDAGQRMVHAKIYRFFTQNPKREICFIGSANLTSAAHLTGGNFESGFLVDREPPRRPEFWLEPDTTKPSYFNVQTEGEAATSGGTRLNLRYHWDRECAEAYWDAPNTSPQLQLGARGTALGSIEPLVSRTWSLVSPEMSLGIGKMLAETSLFEVQGDCDRTVPLLVQEEGMYHKPSLLFRLTAVDILRYWSLLTAEQRAAFLEARAPELALVGDGADLVTRSSIKYEKNTLFDRFAGYFYAFGCVERAIRTALDDKKEQAADYRLFGKKYDSLGNLLDRIASDDDRVDDVDCYLMGMCARQLCQEIKRDYPEYWSSRSSDVRNLQARFEILGTVRGRLSHGNSGEMESFLVWFDKQFLARAKPVTESAG